MDQYIFNCIVKLKKDNELYKGSLTKEELINEQIRSMMKWWKTAVSEKFTHRQAWFIPCWGNIWKITTTLFNQTFDSLSLLPCSTKYSILLNKDSYLLSYHINCMVSSHFWIPPPPWNPQTGSGSPRSQR